MSDLSADLDSTTLSIFSISLDDPSSVKDILNSSFPGVPVVISHGTVVCDEVKLSALTKLAEITQESRQTELEVEKSREDDEDESSELTLNETSVTSIKDSAPDEDDAHEESFHRRQLCLLEQQKQTKIEAAMEARAAQLQAHSERLQNIIAKRARKREQELKEEDALILMELKDLETLEKNRTALVLQLQAKKNQELAKKIDKMVEEVGRSEQMKRDEHRLKRDLLEKIISKQQRFRDVFTQISDMLRSFPYREEMIASVTPAVSTIKNLSEMMDTLVKQFKVGEVSQLDLTTAESLVDKLESGQLTVKAKLDEIKRQKEQEIKQEPSPEPTSVVPEVPQAAPPPEQVIQAPTPSAVKAPEITPPSQTSSESQHITGLEGYILPHNLEELTSLQGLLESHIANLKPLESDSSLKKFRFQLQMAVNTPLNAISAVSATHVKDKLQRLQSLLRGQQVEVSGLRLVANSHPLGIAFCINLLAERIVAQGEQSVSSKPESAYPIAAVALTLWAEFPLFGQLLLAHFFTQCPCLVPYYAPRTSGMSDKDYYSAQGYRYSSDGQVESREKFLKRMTGTATLFFAILTAKLPRDAGLTPPPTLARVWGWLSSLLNLQPRLDVSATVLLACLEVTGSSLATTYGRQFNKLFAATASQYYPLVKQVSPSDMSGPISRLELFLQTVVKKSSITPPSGILPPNFW